MSSLITTTQVKEQVQESVSLIPLRIQIDADFVPSYRTYLEQIVYNCPAPWTPEDYFRILWGPCVEAGYGGSYVTIERNYERILDEGVTEEELEIWRAQDMFWREKVSPNRKWITKSFKMDALLDPYGDDAAFKALAVLTSVEKEGDIYCSQNPIGNSWYWIPQLHQYRAEAKQGVPVEDRTKIMPWRRCEDNVDIIRALYLDVDDLLTNHNMDADQVAAFILAACEQRNIPLPSAVFFTGRGVCASWYVKPVKGANKIRRWRLSMERLRNMLADVMPDPAVADPSRVLRVPGSINTKSGAMCRPLWVRPGQGGRPYEHDFNKLCDEILPMSSDEYRDLCMRQYIARGLEFKRINAERKAATEAYRHSVVFLTKKSATLPQHKGRHSYARVSVEDLEKIHKRKWGGGHIPRGNRNRWLLAWVSAKLVLVRPANMKAFTDEIVAKGVEIGLKGMATAKAMAPAYQRMLAQHAVNSGLLAGEGDAEALKAKTKWGAKEGSQGRTVLNYSFSAKRLIDLFRISDAEMRSWNLRVLISTNIRRERDRTRKALERGQLTTPISLEEKAAQYAAEGRAIKALMEKKGLSQRGVATELGVSLGLVQRRLKRMENETSRTDSACPCKDNRSEPARRGADESVYYKGLSNPEEALVSIRKSSSVVKLSDKKWEKVREGAKVTPFEPEKPVEAHPPKSIPDKQRAKIIGFGPIASSPRPQDLYFQPLEGPEVPLNCRKRLLWSG